MLLSCRGHPGAGPIGYDPLVVLGPWATGPVLGPLRCCIFVLKDPLRCGALRLRASCGSRSLDYNWPCAATSEVLCFRAEGSTEVYLRASCGSRPLGYWPSAEPSEVLCFCAAGPIEVWGPWATNLLWFYALGCRHSAGPFEVLCFGAAGSTEVQGPWDTDLLWF